MRVWNKPELAEININMTENGIFDWDFETLILLNDDLGKKKCYPDKPVKPHPGCNKPEEPKRGVDDLS